MRNVMLAVGRFTVAAQLCVLVACGGESSPTGPPTTPPPASTPAIALALSVDSVGVFKGDSATVLATITRSGGYTGDVTLTVNGATAGVTVVAGAVGSGNSTLVRIAAAASAATGAVGLTVQASGAGVTTVSRSLKVGVTDFVLGLMQMGPDLIGSVAGSEFGRSVSISDDGNRIAVGGPLHSTAAASGGVVRVFQWNGTQWNQQGNDITGASLQMIGAENSVAISGDGRRVAVGRPRAGNLAPFSWVDVWELVGGSWTNVGGSITGSLGWGTSVDLSTDGNRVSIGIPVGDGVAGVYELVGSTWTQVGPFFPSEGSGDNAGRAVALSGDGIRLAVSAPNNDGGGNDAGHVRVLELGGPSWNLVGQEIDGDVAGGLLGQTVSMSRDGARIAVSASGGDYVKVFELVGGTWTQMGQRFDVVNSESQIVALSADGSRMVLGLSEQGAGTVRVYEWDGSSWNQLFADVTGSSQSRLGAAVGMSADGSRVVVGLPGTDTGAARVYMIP